MARRKKPDVETFDETMRRRVKEAIANASNRSEKTSWNRKMDNMVKLITQLRPIEDKIVALEAQKYPIMDEITALRKLMLNECIHPYEYIELKSDHAECKFCCKRLSIPDVSNDREEV